METKNSTSKVYKPLCITGSLILLVMAFFHGSGYSYISKIIMQSNAEEFLKEIIPILFAHPSIHLIGLAAFGILALFLKKESRKVLFLLTLLIIIDGLLAFYLGVIVAGILLIVAALCFSIAGNSLTRNEAGYPQDQ